MNFNSFFAVCFSACGSGCRGFDPRHSPQKYRGKGQSAKSAKSAKWSLVRAARYAQGTLIAVLLLAIAGCTAPPACGSYSIDGVSHDGRMCLDRTTRDISISSAFPPEAQASIIEGGAMWERATAGRVQLTWRVVDHDADVSPAHGFGASGQSDAYRGSITLETDLGPQWVAQVMAHELGHSFGLGHTNAPDQLMDPSALAPAPTAADVARFDVMWANAL